MGLHYRNLVTLIKVQLWKTQQQDKIEIKVCHLRQTSISIVVSEDQELGVTLIMALIKEFLLMNKLVKASKVVLDHLEVKITVITDYPKFKVEEVYLVRYKAVKVHNQEEVIKMEYIQE